jgi:dTMP kinase
MHICIEGIDGTGKSTLVKAVADELKKQNKNVFVTSEPGNQNQEVSMKIRDLVLNKAYEEDIDDTSREALLATNRRIQHIKSKKMLAAGNVVVQDRGWLSGFSYSQAKGFDLNFIETINEQLNPNFKNMFDYIIYLNNNKNVKDTLEKAQECKQEFSAGDIIEAKGSAFQEEVRDNFCALVKQYENELPIVQIDIYDGDRRRTVEELVSMVIKKVQKTILMFMGNSGAGKSTLEFNLVKKYPNVFSRVVSYTSRPIDLVNRKEVEGVHYNFITKEKYISMRDNGEFIQMTEYGENLYASSYDSYQNKTPYTIVSIVPSKGKKLAEELSKKGYNVKIVLFDISNDLIKKNLIKEGKSEEEIIKRFNRGNLKEEFLSEELTADISVTDNQLNNNLPETFVKMLKETK